ncbi:hypothetical protein LUW75_18845 [Streptomyces sp. MRC013]|uniref:hypothetical protein n=1 Tax=Streptomyces sp. MRC013 TaxID=2898276 RepID=UPI0020271415|nr:hypothetical protein [Streptomyces sp. MRC013]URM91691.1 hypothetical protein LUW75_18845 [Streptomyces sp. MRC013]
MDWSWWTVLYIAFGVVALWLLGEVLLQYKARLRWRLLAFFGFLGVVAGVLASSIVLIIAGAAAFGVGQTCVTLSFLRGFSTGWALGGRPGASRRRRVARGNRDHGPVLEVTEPVYDEPQVPPAPDAPPAHGPLPDGTGEYGAHDPAGTAPSAADHPVGYGEPPVYDPGPYPHGHGHGYGYGPGYGYGGDDPRQYAACPDPYAAPVHPADPYAGTAPAHADPYADAVPAHPDVPQHGAHDPYGQPYTAGPYASQYAADTPPGGVWVPPRRDGAQQFPPPPPPYGYGPDGLQQHH